MNSSRTVLLTMFASLAFALGACQRTEGPAERAGKQIDSAAQTAGAKVEQAGDKIEDAAKQAKKDLSK